MYISHNAIVHKKTQAADIKSIPSANDESLLPLLWTLHAMISDLQRLGIQLRLELSGRESIRVSND